MAHLVKGQNYSLGRRRPSLPANSPELLRIPQQDKNSLISGSEKRKNPPPLNNMGALLTAPVEKPKDNQCLFDWVSWTFKTENPQEAIELSGLGRLDFSPCNYGGMGYRQSLRSGNVVIFFDGNPGMGCHVSMTGQGCRQYEAATHCGPIGWYRLLHRLDDAGANFTRLDLAVDNVDGALNIETLQACIDDGEWRTRFKGGQQIKKFSFLKNPLPQGKTIYLGSPTSRIKIRFYDKAAQLGIEGHWIRCELQLMAARAIEAIKHILKGLEVGMVALAVLNNYFAVVNIDDSNKTRCTLKDWWAAWLTTTDKLKLTTNKAIKLVGEVIQHIKNQYAPSIAMIRKCLGVTEFKSFIDELILNGTERMLNKHKLIIENSIQIECLPF
jgi:phage replication initiation protein